LNREAIRHGSQPLEDRATHDVTLPSTRLLAGHADYTPVHFGPRSRQLHLRPSIATACILGAPLVTFGANPSNLLAHPCLDMLKSIPPSGTKPSSCSSEIGEAALFARRTGATVPRRPQRPDPRKVKVPPPF